MAEEIKAEIVANVLSVLVHEGDNIGRGSILSLLSGKANGQARSSVFGCSLFDTETNAN